MKLQNRCIGINQGDVALFSDFESGGDMWTGKGPRQRRKTIEFSEPYKSPPAVHLGFSLWDMDTEASVRAELVAENVTEEGFDIVFRTWADSKIARVRVSWMTIGEMSHEDDWDIY